jgi:hypothetical protein
MSETNPKFLSERQAEEYKRLAGFVFRPARHCPAFSRNAGKADRPGYCGRRFAGQFFAARPGRLHIGECRSARIGDHPSEPADTLGGKLYEPLPQSGSVQGTTAHYSPNSNNLQIGRFPLQ